MKKNSEFVVRACLPCCLFLNLVANLVGCGTDPSFDFQSLAERQPYVVKVEPKPGAPLAEPVNFELTFSERIDLSGINNQSVSLIIGDMDPELESNPRELLKEMEEKKLSFQQMQYLLSGDEKTLTLLPQEPLEDGAYHLVVTPLLLSIQGIPFNQTPGEKTTAFLADYFMGLEPPPESPTDGPGNTVPVFGPEPDFLRINEILYDGLNSETDGEAFIELYGTPGTDISAYQISLINGADGEETDRIHLPMGALLPTDGIFVIADLRTNSTDQTRVANYDYLDQFDPQNGPDAVHLLNRDGKVLDGLAYGEGALLETAEGLAMGEGFPAPDAPAGQSISRHEGSDTQDNLTDFSILTLPNPGTL